MLDLRDQILVSESNHLSSADILRKGQASPKDIEDLASVGRLAHTCPYFGSRRAIPQAEARLV
jgi:chromosome transmission fidelity protein 1